MVGVCPCLSSLKQHTRKSYQTWDCTYTEWRGRIDCLPVGAWAQTWQELCKGCPWFSQLPSVLPGASSSGNGYWLWCWCQQPAHVQRVPWRWHHLTDAARAVYGEVRWRWTQSEERIHTGLRKPKILPKSEMASGNMLWKSLSAPSMGLPALKVALRIGSESHRHCLCSAREDHSHGAA